MLEDILLTKIRNRPPSVDPAGRLVVDGEVVGGSVTPVVNVVTVLAGHTIVTLSDELVADVATSARAARVTIALVDLIELDVLDNHDRASTESFLGCRGMEQALGSHGVVTGCGHGGELVVVHQLSHELDPIEGRCALVDPLGVLAVLTILEDGECDLDLHGVSPVTANQG